MLAILSRIDDLRRQGLWSLRQLKRFVPPPRPKTHRDYLLEEMVRGGAAWQAAPRDTRPLTVGLRRSAVALLCGARRG